MTCLLTGKMRYNYKLVFLKPLSSILSLVIYKFHNVCINDVNTLTFSLWFN